MNFAVSSKSGNVVDFLDIHGCGEGLSRILKNREQPFEFRHPENLGQDVVSVETITLNDALNKANIESLDFVSIDIEGGEHDALMGLDLEKYNPSVLLIENKENQFIIREFMKRRGYSFHHRIVKDDIFTNLI